MFLFFFRYLTKYTKTIQITHFRLEATYQHTVQLYIWSKSDRSRRGRDRMVVGFTTTYAIRDYHHWCCEFESRSPRGVQHYV